MTTPAEQHDRELTFASELRASVEDVWSSAGTMQGVNDELFPLLRMTYPRRLARLDAVPVGRRAFRSWLLFAGLFPVDYDDLTMLEVTPNGGFVEVSQMLTQRVWRHERRLRATAGGCIVTDVVSLTPRLALMGRPFRAVVRLVFSNRHRRLRRRFGGWTLP